MPGTASPTARDNPAYFFLPPNMLRRDPDREPPKLLPLDVLWPRPEELLVPMIGREEPTPRYPEAEEGALAVPREEDVPLLGRESP